MACNFCYSHCSLVVSLFDFNKSPALLCFVVVCPLVSRSSEQFAVMNINRIAPQLACCSTFAGHIQPTNTYCGVGGNHRALYGNEEIWQKPNEIKLNFRFRDVVLLFIVFYCVFGQQLISSLHKVHCSGNFCVRHLDN